MAATLTPGATTGRNITFTASEAVFLAGDVGRQIIYQASRGIIVEMLPSAGSPGPEASVKVDIIDDFPNTDPIPAGDWFVRLSPQAKLTPSVVAPVGTKIILTADRNTFRSADLGKYILIYGGVVEIQEVTSTTVVVGEILNELHAEEISAGSGTYPPAQPGTWFLEVSSWSPENGFPRTGEFVQGRLFQTSTAAQPTTIWGSASDNFDNYGVGSDPDDAIEYTVASRILNRFEWIAENIDPVSYIQTSIILGGTNAEFIMGSGEANKPFGGDLIPLVNKSSDEGSMPVQAVTLGNKILFVDRTRRKIFLISYNVEEDSRLPIELTAAADHITASGIRMGGIAVQKRPDRRVYFVRADGTMTVYTHLPNEKVMGFSRYVTQGFYEAVGCVTSNQVAKPDLVYVVVRRISGAGETRRFVEVFDEEYGGFTRPWQALYTDSAVVYQGVPITVLTGLQSLDGLVVDVIADGSYKGQQLVVDESITLEEAASEIEVGLHYDSEAVTMRPTIQGANIEGLARNWTSLFARLQDTIGGTINTELIQYPPPTLSGQLELFSGDVKVTPPGYEGDDFDLDGAITIKQTQPYPMTVLSLFGTLKVADRD